MTRTLKYLCRSVAATGLLATQTMTSLAQDALDAHHSKAPSATTSSPQSPQAQSQPAQPAPSGAQMPGGMGGMMAPDHMPKMMQMMQEMHAKMMGAGMTLAPKGDASPASQAFNGIVSKMYQDMMISYTGNADVDFVKGMIPHHQGAIDMAKAVLAFGHDKDVKEMAEDVIKAQEKEIAMMNAWLKEHGHW